MLYITYVNLFSNGYIGVKKKIFAQMEVFKKNYDCVYYTVYIGQMIYLMSENNILEKKLAVTKQECNNQIMEWVQKYGIWNVYIRYDFSNKWFIDFMKETREKNVTVIIEFPTIPYDGEISNDRLKLEDNYYRQQLTDYVGQCTTYGNYDSVFGIPCISLTNGIDLEQHPMHKIRKPDGKIVLLAVASMNRWHGYERVIEGMADYYANHGTENIIFRLAGEGPEINKYHQLTDKYGLQKHVEFLGCLEGEMLDQQYDEADIAIGTLAMYKIKITAASPIKLREYCARGIPFIYGYEDIDFSGKEKYLLKVPNDSSPVDIKQVIHFYKESREYGFYTDEMRQYVSETYTWNCILKPVVDYYNKNND